LNVEEKVDSHSAAVPRIVRPIVSTLLHFSFYIGAVCKSNRLQKKLIGYVIGVVHSFIQIQPPPAFVVDRGVVIFDSRIGLGVVKWNLFLPVFLLWNMFLQRIVV